MASLKQLSLAASAPSPRRLELRSALAHLMGRSRRRTAVPKWLTPATQRRGRYPVPAPDRLAQLAHPLTAHACSLETFHASRLGVEVRRPYRDRRLVEFMAAVPAYLLYRNGWTKYLLREAMQGILPESVRLRTWQSTLLPLAARGLLEKEGGAVSSLLDGKTASWRDYVRAGWLEEVFPARLRAGLDGAETVIAWQCLTWEIWRRHHAPGALSKQPRGATEPSPTSGLGRQ